MEFKNLFRRKTQEEKDAEAELKRVQDELRRDQELLSGKKSSSGKKVLTYGLATAIGAGVAFEGSKIAGDYVGSKIPTGKAERRVNNKKAKAPGFQVDTNASLTNLAQGATLKKETPIPAEELEAMQVIKKPETPPRAPEETSRSMPPSPAIKLDINIAPDQPAVSKAPESTEELTARIEQVVQKRLADELAKRDVEIAKLKAKSSAPVVAATPRPTEETYDDKLKRIREKVKKGIKRDYDETDFLRKHVANESAKRAEERVQKAKEVKEESAKARVMAEIQRAEVEKQMNTVVPLSTGEIRVTGGNPAVGENFVFQVGGNDPWGNSFNRHEQTSNKENMRSNPLKLSPEMLEKIEIVYDSNLAKVFPDGSTALKTWMKVQNKSAFELMNTPETKVKKDQKLLRKYVDQLKGVTGLTPKINETVIQFVERALDDAASKNKLPEATIK